MAGIEVVRAAEEGDAGLRRELGQSMALARERAFDIGQMSGEWSASMTYWGMVRSFPSWKAINPLWNPGCPGPSVAVVMADGLEHEAERVEPEHGEVRRRVLRPLLRRVEHGAAGLRHVAVDEVHRVAGGDDEGEML
jgi:hypothetical protein